MQSELRESTTQVRIEMTDAVNVVQSELTDAVNLLNTEQTHAATSAQHELVNVEKSRQDRFTDESKLALNESMNNESTKRGGNMGDDGRSNSDAEGVDLTD